MLLCVRSDYNKCQSCSKIIRKSTLKSARTYGSLICKFRRLRSFHSSSNVISPGKKLVKLRKCELPKTLTVSVQIGFLEISSEPQFFVECHNVVRELWNQTFQCFDPFLLWYFRVGYKVDGFANEFRVLEDERKAAFFLKLLDKCGVFRMFFFGFC